MENEKNNKKDMPDFKQLNDRVIAEPTSGPTFSIKTNLDPKDVTEDNPYLQDEQGTVSENFRSFFEE